MELENKIACALLTGIAFLLTYFAGYNHGHDANDPVKAKEQGGKIILEMYDGGQFTLEKKIQEDYQIKKVEKQHPKGHMYTCM